MWRLLINWKITCKHFNSRLYKTNIWPFNMQENKLFFVIILHKSIYLSFERSKKLMKMYLRVKSCFKKHLIFNLYYLKKFVIIQQCLKNKTKRMKIQFWTPKICVVVCFFLVDVLPKKIVIVRFKTFDYYLYVKLYYSRKIWYFSILLSWFIKNLLKLTFHRSETRKDYLTNASKSIHFLDRNIKCSLTYIKLTCFAQLTFLTLISIMPYFCISTFSL